MTGVSESTVSRIFSREVEPKFRDVASIAKVVGVSLDDLAGIARHESEEVRELRLKVREQDVEIRSQASVIVSHEREIARADKALPVSRCGGLWCGLLHGGEVRRELIETVL